MSVRLLACLVGVVGVALPLAAAEFTIDPALRVSGEYESNPLLRTARGQGEAYGVALDAGAGLGWRSASSSALLMPRVVAYRFDRQNLNRVDRFVDGEFEHRFSERFKTGLDAELLAVSTLASEADDTGLRRARGRRDTLHLEPRAEYQASATDRVAATLFYADTRYNFSSTDDFNPHDLGSASLRWTHQWEAVTETYVEPFVSRFRNRENEDRTDSFGGYLGARTQLTPTLTADARAGAVRSEAEFERTVIDADGNAAVVEGRARGGDVLGGLELEKTFSPVSKATLEFQRQTRGSGRGVQRLRDQVLLGVEQALTERVEARLRGRYQRNRIQIEEASATPGQGGSDRNFETVAELRYRLAQNWYVGGGYRYRLRESGDEDDDGGGDGSATGHGAFVYLSYSGPPRPAFR